MVSVDWWGLSDFLTSEHCHYFTNLPSQHVHSLFFFTALVFLCWRPYKDLWISGTTHGKKDKREWSMEDKCWNSNSEGKRHFLATCERTKHTKITTVAVQGLDNTCANCPECQINKQDLIYYEDPSAICCKIKTLYEPLVVLYIV